jgi:hypothetical protein
MGHPAPPYRQLTSALLEVAHSKVSEEEPAEEKEAVHGDLAA